MPIYISQKQIYLDQTHTTSDIADAVSADSLRTPGGHLLLTPDSGPMHMANAVGCKVIGLHAASNPDRSGPYSDRRWCVNRYDQAARRFMHKPAAALPWGKKIEQPGVMDLVTVDDVIERLEALCTELGLA